MCDCKSKLKKSHLDDVRNEVTSSFTIEEIIACGSFENFFKEVDVQNAYEEEWRGNEEYWKPYFEAVYNELVNVPTK